MTKENFKVAAGIADGTLTAINTRDLDEALKTIREQRAEIVRLEQERNHLRAIVDQVPLTHRRDLIEEWPAVEPKGCLVAGCTDVPAFSGPNGAACGSHWRLVGIPEPAAQPCGCSIWTNGLGQSGKRLCDTHFNELRRAEKSTVLKAVQTWVDAERVVHCSCGFEQKAGGDFSAMEIAFRHRCPEKSAEPPCTCRPSDWTRCERHSPNAIAERAALNRGEKHG